MINNDYSDPQLYSCERNCPSKAHEKCSQCSNSFYSSIQAFEALFRASANFIKSWPACNFLNIQPNEVKLRQDQANVCRVV